MEENFNLNEGSKNGGQKPTLILSHEDIISLNIPLIECIKAVEEVLKEHAQGKVKLKPKLSIKRDGGIFFTAMPAYVEKLNKIGIKWVNRIPTKVTSPRITGTMLLNDPDSADLLAVMEATWITAIRTGAVAALTAKNLGKPNFETISFIGLGNTATAALKCMLELCPHIKKVKAYNYNNSAQRFFDQFSDKKQENNLEFEICDEMEDIFLGTDVVVTAVTYAAKPFVKKEWLFDGILAIPIHTRGWQDCDPLFDKVYADDHGHVIDFMPQITGELGEVILGLKPARENDQEKIMAYNIGIAIDDVAISNLVYKTALERGVGKKMKLSNFTSKSCFI
jgi:alanine dehydrogenase